MGRSIPWSMVAVRRITLALLEREDLPIDARLALHLLLDAAGHALMYGVADLTVDSSGADETRRRVTEVAKQARLPIKVRDAKPDQRAPSALSEAKRSDTEPLVRSRLMLHRLGDGSTVERAVLVYDYLRSFAAEYQHSPKTVLARLQRGLPLFLGKAADMPLVQQIVEAMLARGQRGQRLWEPLAVLVGVKGAAALRLAVARAHGKA